MGGDKELIYQWEVSEHLRCVHKGTTVKALNRVADLLRTTKKINADFNTPNHCEPV